MVLRNVFYKLDDSEAADILRDFMEVDRCGNDGDVQELAQCSVNRYHSNLN